MRGHAEWVTAIAVSPNDSRIASASSDDTIRVWDAKSGLPVGGPFKGHLTRIICISFSPDNRYILSGSYDTTIRLWHVESEELIGEPLYGHTEGVTSVAFSPDGMHLASSCFDETIRLWDTSSGTRLGKLLHGQQGTASPNIPPSDTDSRSSDDPDPSAPCINAVVQFSDDSELLPNGWVVSRGGSLLFWVPSVNQRGLLRPSNSAVMGALSTRIDASRFIHGRQWTACSRAGD